MLGPSCDIMTNVAELPPDWGERVCTYKGNYNGAF